MAVSQRDREHMARLAAYKDATHREARERHLARSLAERLRRSWQLYLTFRGSTTAAPAHDPQPFYHRARQLGLIRD